MGKQFLHIWIALILLSGFALADNEPLIEVQSKVDTSVITIGDHIHYSIIINRAKGLRIARPGEGVNLGMFEIKAYDFPKPVEKNGHIIERFNFTISVYDTGKYTIPPFPVAYFTNDTTKHYRIIEAPPIDITVKSVITGSEARDIKDVKPPLNIPFNYRFWLSMLGVLILLIVIGWLVYRLWKKRKERGYLFTPPPPPRPAHEIALEDLRQLFSEDLLEKGEFKEFFSRLSDIIRTYLEGRYAVPAMERTTAEITYDLRPLVDDDLLFAELQNMLSLSDLVKFAKYKPLEKEIEQVKEQALGFVEKTRVMPEPVADENEAVLNDGSEESGIGSG